MSTNSEGSQGDFSRKELLARVLVSAFGAAAVFFGTTALYEGTSLAHTPMPDAGGSLDLYAPPATRGMTAAEYAAVNSSFVTFMALLTFMPRLTK